MGSYQDWHENMCVQITLHFHKTIRGWNLYFKKMKNVFRTAATDSEGEDEQEEEEETTV